MGEKMKNIWENTRKLLKGWTWKEEKSLNSQQCLREWRKVFFLSKIPMSSKNMVTKMQPSLWYSLHFLPFHSNRLQITFTRNLPTRISKVYRGLDALQMVSWDWLFHLVIHIWLSLNSHNSSRQNGTLLTRLEQRAQITSSCDPVGVAFFCGSRLNL